MLFGVGIPQTSFSLAIVYFCYSGQGSKNWAKGLSHGYLTLLTFSETKRIATNLLSLTEACNIEYLFPAQLSILLSI